MFGMSVCAFDAELREKKRQGTMIGLLFSGVSIAVYMVDVRNSAVSFVLELVACTAVILVVAGFEEKLEKLWNFLQSSLCRFS